jgi:selenocysteine lyase/cysteine desulfurase
MNAAVAYLEQLGSEAGAGRTERLHAAMTRIGSYERDLSCALLDAIQSIEGVSVHGVTDRGRLRERVPTIAFTVAGTPSAAVAEALAARGVGVRAGHMYSPRLITRLGLMPDGVVRASLVHYNTLDEIDRFRAAVAEIVNEA